MFKPSLNCPRPMEAKRTCVGSEFQTVGAATWKLRTNLSPRARFRKIL